MAGLFDGFEGYRVVADAERRSALTSALVAVDANVLLNLYRYNARTTNDLLAIFERLGDRLVVPHQAVREFHRNRLSAIGNPEQATTEARNGLDKSRHGAARALDVWSKKVALDESELRQLHSEIEQVFRRLQDVVDRAAPDRVHPTTPTEDDPVLRRLTELLDGKVLARPDDERWNELITQGNKRVEDEVPPGYLDVEKGEQFPEGASGDFLVYIQACVEAKARDLDLLIVTNDEKEDWWWRRGAELIGPRREMTEEFFALASRRLYLMRPSDLLVLSDALDLTVDPESAKDADTSRADIEDLGKWTVEAVDTLLERLRGEGRRGLADVIVEAARQGGTLGRDAVYALCGYDEDRLLVGFTRPTARIAGDLQAEELLPATVRPMLTPLYRGPGRLYALRVPPEVVAMFGSDETTVDDAIEPDGAGKYAPLTDYLQELADDSATMTFAELEGLLAAPLAPSARKYPQYWYSPANSLGKAVDAAGFKARLVRLKAETVEFARRTT
ncbi:PIN-like domain-containing protein [Micromonospora arida]|uniref:Uncharacterized protein n=1 Tax=Micromonospora arida TaxID=2203715 RepID=A0A3N9XJP5_9ACTN|nr:PIN-like domain-containing protein [Micromonospora arida]RQX07593.1 hypothetical protein DLJ58_20905 [Micromonospora arida]